MARYFVTVISVLVLGILPAVPSLAEKNLARPPGTTRYVPMVHELQALAAYDRAHAGRMSLQSLGQSVKGRPIWMVTLQAPNVDNSAAAPKKLFYLCRQHGHEPASTEAALALIKMLVYAAPDAPLIQDLEHVTVSLVPMANPDGAEAFLRHNAHDVDLNRDWVARTQPETRVLYRAIMRLRPDLMTDQHELYPDDTRPDFTETVGAGSGADPNLIADCDQTQDAVQGAMLAAGYPTVEHRINDNHPPRLAHRFGCLITDVPTLLFETNRLAGHGRTVADRAAAQENFMVTVLRDLAGERSQLLTEASAWQAAHIQSRESGKSQKTAPAASD